MTYSSTIVLADKYTHPYRATHSNPRQSRDTMRLTSVWQHCIMYGNKEKHGLGDSKADHLRSGLVPNRKSKEEWDAISLCTEKKSISRKTSRRALHCSTLKVRGNEQRGDIGETDQSRKQIGVIPKNDFGPSRAGNLIDGP